MFKNLMTNHNLRSMNFNICEKLQYFFDGYFYYSYNEDSDALLSEYHKYEDNDNGEDEDRSPITNAPGIQQDEV